MRTTLQNPPIRGLFVPMNCTVTPDELDRCADGLDEAARVLRHAANVFRGVASIRTIAGTNLAAPTYLGGQPTVNDTAEAVLREAEKPLHITELYERVRTKGAFVKNHQGLSSMLSKDPYRRFRPALGQRGFWQLVQKSSTKGT